MVTIYEAVDAPSSAATPYLMGAGDAFFGTLPQNGSDWVAVTLVAGRSYSFGAVGMGVTDPYLKLYAPGGAVLALDDDGGPGGSARISYTATVSGLVYLEARALAGDGGYGLVVTEGSRPSYGAEMVAALLGREGDSWGSGVTLTWGVRTGGPAWDATGKAAPFVSLTAPQVVALRGALAHYAEVAGITFSEVSAGTPATVMVGGYTSATDNAGAYAYGPGTQAAPDKAGDVWINARWASGTALTTGTYDAFVLLHELGHALGLEHPGDYDAVPGVTFTYAGAAQYQQDSRQYTVMSYFPATATEAGAPGTYPDTLMLHDILAVQRIYGVNTATRAGDDIYGFGGTLGGAYDFAVNRDPLLCIWDGGGRDRLDLSGFAGRQRVDLSAGAFSDVGGFRGNLSIALGVVIEDAVGGRGADRILGNAADNRLRGAAGADHVAGGAGNDLLTGNAGADRFIFGAGDGRDRITDFTPGQDRLLLSDDLWGGGAMTAGAVLFEFASLRRGGVVLDFGADEIALAGVTQIAGLEDSLLIF